VNLGHEGPPIIQRPSSSARSPPLARCGEAEKIEDPPEPRSGHGIATRRRLARAGNVTFEDLMRATPNFDVRTVTIEGLTSVRYLLSVTVGEAAHVSLAPGPEPCS